MIYGKHNFAKASENFASYRDLKSIMLGHRNDYAECSNMMIALQKILTFQQLACASNVIIFRSASSLEYFSNTSFRTSTLSDELRMVLSAREIIRVFHYCVFEQVLAELSMSGERARIIDVLCNRAFLSRCKTPRGDASPWVRARRRPRGCPRGDTQVAHVCTHARDRWKGFISTRRCLAGTAGFASPRSRRSRLVLVEL